MQVACRIPGDELEPVPLEGEVVVFAAHFERGFGLPASDFFRRFLDFFELQPHHLPGNAIFYLSCYISFMEAYVGLLPTIEAFSRFFTLRINSIQDRSLPKPKPPVQCGACIVTARQGSPFYKFSGLDSCRAWQETFFYVKNTGAADLINLPAYLPGAPSRANWRHSTGNTHVETNRIVRFMEELNKDTDICSDDIIRAFISRRVLPLQRRVHKIGQMSGRRDPTRITSFGLSKSDMVLKAKQICQTEMPVDWSWGLRPLSFNNPPSDAALERFPRIAAEVREPCRKRQLDKEDPDPYVSSRSKMGRTHTSRPGNSSASNVDKGSSSDDDLLVLEVLFPLPRNYRFLFVKPDSADRNPQVLESVTPISPEVGPEWMNKAQAQAGASRTRKAPEPTAEAGSGGAPPAKRVKKSALGPLGRKPKSRIPTSSGRESVLIAF
ncbi:hypothetical protein QYE76_002966 [Lolium multiflorum]|uniref:Transposase (putative) gypsy type domain-containing protein n=1 Tax=Lolium multiflorum TaxID=4521 RepID=A0AAD8W152_LOLMU|nr:hypothetical protein QYE76_002966 [Lolium multiflorum]